MDDKSIFGVLVGAAFLGLIPATIAKKKGHSFFLWWVYGCMLFLIAFIHACVLRDKNAQVIPPYLGGAVPYYPQGNQQLTNQQPANQSVADELKKFKELYDQGVLTEEEFQAKKEQLLKLM